jgi:hypothetical protein
MKKIIFKQELLYDS